DSLDSLPLIQLKITKLAGFVHRLVKISRFHKALNPVNKYPFSWLQPMHIPSMPLIDEGFLYGSCSETSCPRFRCFRDTRHPMTISGLRQEKATCRVRSRTKCEPLRFL